MDISQITNYLFVGAEPKTEDNNDFREQKVHLVISMIGARQPPEMLVHSLGRLLWLPSFDTFLTPIPVRKLMTGVEAALPIIQNGHRVFVFCAQGRHRSVVMSSAILIAMGHSAEESMQLIQLHRKKSDPQARHVRRQILLFEKRWKDQGEGLQKFYYLLYDMYCEFIVSLISNIICKLGLDKGFLAKRL